MSITNGYTTAAEVKAVDALNLDDTTSDSIIEIIVEAASRQIDYDCGRYFYKSTADETRYYTAQNSTIITLPDDLLTITTLATDDGDYTYGNVWTTSDYMLEPFNATAIGRPYYAIEAKINGSYLFPTFSRGVKIVGTFGWTAVPDAISQACILLSSRIFKRLSTPLGVASIASMGEVQVSIKDKDPDYYHLISAYKVRSLV